MTVGLDAAVMPPSEREELVRALVWERVVRVEITHQPRPVAIEVVGRITDVGELNICSIRSNATTVERTPRLAHDADDAFVFLSLQLTGTSMVIQDGRQAVLRPGDFALYDTRRPYTLVNDEGIHQHFFRFPVEALGLSGRILEDVTAVRLDGERPLAAVAATHLRTLATGVAGMSSVERGLIVDPSMSLVRAMVSAQAGGRRARDDLEHSLWLRITHFVREHLTDPDLTPAEVAKAHHISLRHLYVLFAGREQTPSEWIVRLRLEAARADLVAGASNIAATAHRYGFKDASHFARRFKAAYGVTPREWQRR